MNVLAVAAGGAVGAVLRWWLSRLNGSFPWGTLLANMLGCLVLGVLSGAYFADLVLGPPTPLLTFAATGALGSLTTFSTFAVESVTPRWPRGGYVTASVCGGLALAWLGLWVGASIVG